MSTDKIIMILDKINGYFVDKPMHFVLTGGEPFIRKDIFKIAETISLMDNSFSISTNGTLVTDEYIKRLSEHNLSFVQVSLDGIKDNFLRKGSFGVSDFERISDIMNKHDVGVVVSTVVTSKNIHEIPAVSDFCEENDVVKHRIQRYKPVVPGLSPSLPEVKQLVKSLKAKENVEIDEAFPYEIKRAFGSNVIQSCVAGENCFAIRPDGKVYFCPHWVMSEKIENHNFFMVGDILSQRIEDIMNQESNDRFSDFDITKLKGRCSDCKYLKMCKGGCRVAAIYHGDLYGPDPLCSRQG